MKSIFTSLLILISFTLFAQKKVLDHKDFEIWQTIKNQSISNDGNFVMYSLEKGEKDSHLKIKDAKSSLVFEHERSEKGQFTFNSKFALFTIKPWRDSIKELKRKKVKKEKLPKDSIGIYNFSTKSLDKIGNIESYKTPEKWSGSLAYLLEDIVAAKKEKDTVKAESKKKDKKKAKKKVGKDNGYHLVVRDLVSKKQDTFKYVTNYTFAKNAKMLAFTATGEDSISEAGVYVLNLENNKLIHVFEAEKAKYYELNFSESGKNLGFVVDADTTKVQVRPNELYIWREGKVKAEKLMDASSAPKGFRVSSDGNINFSKDETKMYFGLAKPPIVQDTTLLDEEIVNVEVWTYNEPRLYTVQELQLKNDQKKSYTAAIHINKNYKLVQLASEAYPDVELGNEGNSEYSLVNTSEPYELESQWTGGSVSDYAIVNVNTGAVVKVLEKIRGRVRLSPNGKYAFGYNALDSTWFTYSIASDKYTELTKGQLFYDELNDSPDYPRSYGSPGWTKNDESLILYDRYDIWSFNPDNGVNKKLTNGRENLTVFRYLKLDNEDRFIDNNKKWLLSTFKELDKDAGYYEFNPKNNKGKQLVTGAYKFSKPLKAENSDNIIFSRESFEEFPNLHYSDVSFKKQTKISDANPQQSDYNWGTVELINWISLDGIELTGMLVKPENFDPTKKYPLLVNFYERSSDDLNDHKTPSPGRSSIIIVFIQVVDM